MNAKLVPMLMAGLLITLSPLAVADHHDQERATLEAVSDVGDAHCVKGNTWHYCAGVLADGCIVSWDYSGGLGSGSECVRLS